MNIWYIISTLFYFGKTPIAPGTMASLITMLIWLLVPLNYFIQIIILIIILILGLISSKIVSEKLNVKDPSEIVIDEVMGMGIALFMLPKEVILYLCAFFLFRVFDILKPSFIYSIQKVPNGWGIMLDDIIAGIFACLICQGIYFTL